MATLGGYYLNVHRSQYDSDSTPITRIMGCGPTTGANGANASSGGKVSKTGQQIHNLVPRAQESDPSTLGWSLADIDKAVTSLGVPFENRTNSGWAGVIAALNAGYYVGLQGDSDRFGNNTCSGAFDGDHIIGIHPATRVVNGLRQHWIDDPICPGGRWEYDYIIRRYAAKLAGSITAARFGVFTHPVPRAVAAPVVNVVKLQYGGIRITRVAKRISVPIGQKANVRYRPSTAAGIALRMANGQVFVSYQVTKTGELLAGSRVWYGDASGTRWLHITAF